MTGINRFNQTTAAFAVFAALCGLAPTQLSADDIMLEGSDRLSGKVLAIQPDGTISLETPLSPAPVEINGGSIKSVLFSTPEVKPEIARCQVSLTNGDVLSAAVASIDDKNVTLQSSVAGPIVVPRAAVSSLRLGVTLPNIIFAGPTGLGGWKRGQDSADQWSFDKGGLKVEGSGSIGRSFDLPPQFIVRFKLAWDNNPNFKFSFASAANPEGGVMDRYFLQFNSAGIGLRRETTGSKRYELLATLNRLPAQFPGNKLTVEIRVDRTARTLQLFLNDEPEGKFKDPTPKAPMGGGILFESLAGDAHELNISEIQIADWDLKGERRPLDDRGDKTKDALIGIESERFSGNLIGTKAGPEGLLYVFKSAFQENAIEVPEDQVATLFLTEPNEPAAVTPSAFSLRFHGGGTLQVSACSFSETEVLATHPLLGPLKLQREQVTAFERVAPKPKAEKKES